MRAHPPSGATDRYARAAAVHRARWGGARSDFADASFHRELARDALARDWLRLWILEVDGRPVAAWHGFQVGTVTSYYQAGRDPGAQRLSVGFVLLGHTIRTALAEGATEYRFGRGDEAFKSRFTDEDPGLETIAVMAGRTWQHAYFLAEHAKHLRGLARRLRGTG